MSINGLHIGYDASLRATTRVAPTMTPEVFLHA